MKLYSTSTNPAPAGANVIAITTRDNVNLRLAAWRSPGQVRGTLLLAQGRGEFIEKYNETIGDMLARGLNIVTFDWRGQGLSDRALRDRRKGHVEAMEDYIEDLAAVEAWMIAQNCPQPWFALGHSMGGALLALRLHTAASNYSRVVLSAPMIDLAGLSWPRGARFLARGLDWLGLGRNYVPGGNGSAYFLQPFAGNGLTSDPQRYAKFTDMARECPDVWTGSPTVHWLDEAFGLMAAFRDIAFPMSISVPCLIIAAGHDRVVDTEAATRFVSFMNGRNLVVIPGAEHELLIERDELREQFLAAFDAFIPGSVSG
ncbi:MAG: alpha/beta hydrolase [Hyphomicrobiales bacterium]|nr:alpha/beta hydrolase [Hyphomicrobiales bacterium]